MRTHLSLFAIFAACVSAADPIHLRNVEFDPAVRVPEVSSRLKAAPTAADAYYLVQLRSTSPSARSAVAGRAGAEVVAFVPDNTFVMKANGASLARLTQHPGVEWVGRFEPAYKISNEIGIRPLFSTERRLERALGMARLTVTLFDGADDADSLSAAGAAGFDLLGMNRVGPRWVIELYGSIRDAERLAHVEDIAYIEESSDRRLRNETTTWVIQSNQTNLRPLWDRGINGEGQIAGIIDSAVYRAHNQFRDPVDNTPGPNHRKLVYYSSSGGINGSGSHGTHCAGTLAGDQQPITGSLFRNGTAYRARLAFKNLGDVGGSDLYPSLVAAHNVGARVHSNSWGDDGTTQYTSDCQQIDQYSYDFEQGMVAFAVTNTSLLKTPENAKSVLAVGATRQSPNENEVGTGGAGPTSDGRRKPEIFAPGVSISSARNGTVDQWRTLTGTSMACPAVTGAAALVRQYMNRGFFNFGIRHHPTGALVRAMLMNSTLDMTAHAGYPSNAEGWGRLQLNRSLVFRGDSRRAIGWDVPNADGFQQGFVYERLFTVDGSAEPLKVTLSFTDFPAAVFAAQAAVNDVDLEIETPGGQVYLGNVMTNGQSNLGGAADPLNSTEMVILNNPSPGTYKMRAIVRTLNQGSAQGMSVVVTGRVVNIPGQG